MTKDKSTKNKSKSDRIPISLARLAAVQVLYQLDSSQCQLAEAISYVKLNSISKEKRIGDESGNVSSLAEVKHSLDEGALASLMNKTLGEQQQIDYLIYSNLTADWPKERLELIVFSVLRVGVAELLGAIKAPHRVTISEYVDIAHAFYDGSEPGLVNAILDKIAIALTK
jgi:N utilization substance protein B